MKFHYLVAAYNEESVLERTIHELAVVPTQHPGSEVFILVNGSGDKTWEMAQKLSSENQPWLSSFHNIEKGMGVAFKRGLKELQKKNLTKDDWVVFSAADLPFGFSDLDSFLKLGPEAWSNHLLFVGSKRHPESQAPRGLKRKIGSLIFETLRFMFLQIRTKDTQGSLILRGDYVGFVDKITSDDYFFTVELVYFAEKAGRVLETPITLSPERRPSKVNLLSDGIKTIKQLFSFKLRLLQK